MNGGVGTGGAEHNTGKPGAEDAGIPHADRRGTLRPWEAGPRVIGARTDPALTSSIFPGELSGSDGGVIPGFHQDRGGARHLNKWGTNALSYLVAHGRPDEPRGAGDGQIDRCGARLLLRFLLNWCRLASRWLRGSREGG